MRHACAIALLLTMCTAACGDGDHDDDVAGGRAGGVLERVDQGPLSPRSDAQAVWTGQEVVVFGGRFDADCPPEGECEPGPAFVDGAAFDPETLKWRSIADAPIPISWAKTAVLNGVVYAWIPDSEEPQTLGNALLSYDPEANTWTRLEMPPDAAKHASLVVATDDRVILYPQIGSGTSLAFDPISGRWTDLPADQLPIGARSMVWTGSELVSISAPGSIGSQPAFVSAAVLEPDADEWRHFPGQEYIGTGSAQWMLHDGLVVNPTLSGADGGEMNGWGRWIPYGGMLDPETETWSAFPDSPEGRWRDHTVPGDVEGKLFVEGWTFQPGSGQWDEFSLPAELRVEGRAAVELWADGRLFSWGGYEGTGRSMEDTRYVEDGGWLWTPPSP